MRAPLGAMSAPKVSCDAGPVQEDAVRPGVKHSGVSPDVSVVVPVYNQQQHLAEAVASILAQTHGNWECVLVDDGSTDGTPEVCARLAAGNGRIRNLRKTNGGVSSARNLGIREARGRWVAFLDADDRLVADFLEKGLAAASSLDPMPALVACHGRRMGCSAENEGLVGTGLEGCDVACRDLLMRNRFPCTVLAAKEVLVSVGGFEESLGHSEDRDLWVRVAAGHRVWLRAGVGVHIRNTPGSASKDASAMRRGMLAVQARARAQPVFEGMPWTFWARARAYLHHQVAWMHADAGQRADAIREVLLSFLNWPGPLSAGEVGEPFLFRLRALRRFLMRHEEGRSNA